MSPAIGRACTKLRAAYEQDAERLLASFQVIAIHFQTVAAANDW